MNNLTNWMIYDKDNSLTFKQIVQFQLSKFSDMFGVDCMDAEQCIIFNDSSADCPMLITSFSPLTLRLAQESTIYFAQTIYQLSHELCHYAIRQHKPNKAFTLKWFEEIICEAVSLYALEISARDWNECAASEYSPNFAPNILRYLQDELDKVGSDGFASCTTVEKLRAYEENDPANYRYAHRNERNLVYQVISQEPEKIAVVCMYMDYLNPDSVSIDFDRWIIDDPCTLLKTLKHIQPLRG